jgi:enoyl-CoA hydratase/carnithine racemase
MKLEDYQSRFSTTAVSRDQDGILTIRLHSKGDSLWWGARPHRELPELFSAVGSDRDNRVVLITGTGTNFVEIPDVESIDDLPRGRTTATAWEQIAFEGNRLITELLAIDVPMIAAVNGPVTVHSELAVLCDIILCTPDTFFQDAAHFPRGLVPGDGMQIVWPMLLGPNRGRQFLLTGAKLPAQEAQRLGVVGEIVEAERLLERAYALAKDLAKVNPVVLRNTRRALVRPIKRAVAHDLELGLSLEAIGSLSAKEWFGD